MPRSRLTYNFWNRHPTQVAIDLIGCHLSVRQPDGLRLTGRIVETEAYHHGEGACHAYSFENRRRSDRVAHFFESAGVSYVYLNYGIHKLLNVITGPGNEGSAVLIRAIRPLKGVESMRQNRNGMSDDRLCNGPGKLTQALGIDLRHNKINVCRRGSPIAFYDRRKSEPIRIKHGPRVGIGKATDLMWRYVQCGSFWISRARENRFLKPMINE